MGFKTPILMALSVLLTVTALSMLGLAADTAAYVHKHHNDPLQIHYNRWNIGTESLFSYWVTIKYVPSRFSLTREEFMIGASIISAIVGGLVTVSSWMRRGDGKSSSKLLPVSIAAPALSFGLSLAAAAYMWYPTLRYPINFLRSLPVPPADNETKPVTYMSPFAFSSEYWNCNLAPYVVEPAQSKRIENLCHEAQAAKYLTIVMLILSAALVVGLGLTWRMERRAAAAADSEGQTKQVEEISVHDKE